MNSSQLQSVQRHNEMLAQFVIRLSKFFEGYSADIDNELQTLRGHLAGTPDFSLASVSIGKLDHLFQGDIKNVRRYTASSLSLIEQSVRTLQQRFAQDTEFRTHAASVLTLANQPTDSLQALLKVCLNSLSLIQKLPTPCDTATPEVRTAPLNPSITRSLQEELQHLLDSYTQLQPDNIQLGNLRHRLLEGLNEDDLLQACLVILRLIVKDSMGEAAMSGEVIQSLHEALGKLNKNVEKSIVHTHQAFVSRQKTDEVFKQQLNDIEDMVAADTGLDGLKEQTRYHLKKMASTLAQRKESERTEQQKIMSLLSRMQTQLDSLERQTIDYRKKLAQQHCASHTDPLTQLPNRMAYNEKIVSAWQHAQASQQPLSLAVLDIDHFKNINDRFGHAAGDKTLQVVANQLAQGLNEGEFIARWGGEEFVLVYENTGHTALAEKLEKLRTRLMALPFKFKQERLTITASFGGATFTADETAEQVFERADQKLYEAKRSGRNCVVIDQDRY